MKPVIIINFKTYKKGKDVVRLAKSAEKINKNIIIGVSPVDIKNVVEATSLRVYSQHVDYYEPGRYTGYIIPEAVKAAGAKGCFLNHSEHKLDFKIIKKTIERCRKIGLKTAVFAANLKEAKNIEKLKPDYLIVEPPELVAGNVSVSDAKPEFIKKIADNLKSNFIVGAGIKTGKDVKKALELGAKGIAVSSAVTKAKKPENVLKDFSYFN
ncbi:MAG: triose-phosphate isomerase [Minisyncoccales bacterium]